MAGSDAESYVFSAPVLLPDLTAPYTPKKLVRVRTLGPEAALTFPERVLQDLIHEHPDILPIEELERAFVAQRSICKELPLAGGAKYVDNLLINADGRICIVECKLWRNPEAIRKVVAQLLDYAAELSKLSYLQLQSLAAKACQESEQDFLVGRVLGEATPEENAISFIDSVSDSLRKGSFLLLVVGDGIRAGLQQMTDLLNRSALGFSFGLVEIAFYREPVSTEFYVQARVLARTEIDVRTLYVLSDRQGKMEVETVSAPTKPLTLTEQEFFQKLAKADPTFPAAVSQLLEETTAAGCSPELKRTYVIYAEGAGTSINLGHINSNGTVTIWGSAGRDEQLGRPIGLEYMKHVAALVPGADIKDTFASQGAWYVRHNGHSTIPLKLLLSRKAEWLAGMAAVVERLQAD